MEQTNNKEEEDSQKSIFTYEQINLINEECRKIKEEPEHFIDWDEARKMLFPD